MVHKNNIKLSAFISKRIIGITSILIIFSIIPILSSDVLSYQTNNSYNFTNEIISFSPKAFEFDSFEKVSSTGWNSTKTSLVYNNDTGNIYLSWLDQFQPFTANAISTLFYSYGSKTTPWSSNILQVEEIDGTVLRSYAATPDFNDTVHFVFDEYSTDNFDLNEVTFLNEAIIQPKTNLLINSGNSTDPICKTDHNGIIHLVHIDKSYNTNGDLYYSFFDSNIGSWDIPFTNITNGASAVANSPPTMTIDENNTLHLIWVDNRTGDYELYYSYKESGNSWTMEEKITTVAFNPINPKIAFDKGSKNIHLIFKDDGTSTNLYYSYAKAKAIGSSWSSPVTISSYLSFDGDYDLISDSLGNTFVVFEHFSAGRTNIYLRQKFNESTTWESRQLISTYTLDAFDPAVTVDDSGTIYISYTQYYEGKKEVYLGYMLIDSDLDGLSDFDEINVYFTNPYSYDSDGDLLSDSDEILIYQTNPNSFDSDSDQMSDYFEIIYGLNPNDPNDANHDIDSDGLTNLEEFIHGTNPYLVDSDFDSLTDGQEVNIYGTDPLNVDTDGDTLSDGYEIYSVLNPLIKDNITEDIDNDLLTTEEESRILTNASKWDTDGDGFSDGYEYYHGTDPLDALDFPITIVPKDYRSLIIGLLSGFGTISFFLLITFLIVRGFRPEDPSKRKELERTEIDLVDKTKTEKGENKSLKDERYNIDTIIKKKQIIQKSDLVETKKMVLGEKGASEEVVDKVPESLGPNMTDQLEKKRASLRNAISALENYQQQLYDMLKTKMTQFTLNTASREALTEFAADSQTFYSEAKAIWTATILPLIKGNEEAFYTDTLDAERIIDQCSKYSDKILEILVKREMEIVEEDAKREEIKRIAQKAIEENQKKQEKEKNNQANSNSDEF
ncbi:MAG: hypothetical protein JXA54_13310 [Candidatus Heimdallarchaeota archaeon]|nr:hypothetical protein [Candidatus Heimdallarchaeota archaeon]